MIIGRRRGRTRGRRIIRKSGRGREHGRGKKRKNNMKMEQR